MRVRIQCQYGISQSKYIYIVVNLENRSFPGIARFVKYVQPMHIQYICSIYSMYSHIYLNATSTLHGL